MVPYKKKSRFYNCNEEKARSRILNMAQVAWHVMVRRLRFGRPPFFGKEFDLRSWIEKPDFVSAKGKSSITWFGHSTCLINIAGISILTDPIAGGMGKLLERALPLPVSFNEIPHVDIIVLSHNHRDHLDVPTLKALSKKSNPIVLVPQGDGTFVRQLGFQRVHECEWHELVTIETNEEERKIEIFFLPAIHWSGRGVLDVNRSLWGSWLFRVSELSVYFAGDTAYGKHFFDIAHRYGPPDVVLMPIAPEEPRELMAPSHIGVEEALKAFEELAASHFFPIHWGTFAFGMDSFQSPMEKLKQLWPHSKREDKKLHIVPAGRVVIMDRL